MSIKNLITLDFYTMKPLAKIMISFLIIPIIIGFVADIGTSIMVTLTFVVFMLNSVFAIAEKSNFNKLYGILPIKRSHSILSRYLFSLIVLFFAAIVSFLLFIALSLIIDKSVSWVNGIAFLSISIFIAVFFISIQYPFYFKFEYSKATIMAVLPYVVCFAIGAPLLNYLMKNITFFTNVMNVVTYFQANTGILILSSLSLSALLLLISYTVSIKIQKKEF